jgi:TatD DNase family protein
MRFLDSHAHLADPAFDVDRDEVIARARAAGAVAVVAIGESLDAARRSHDLAGSHAGFVFFTAGVHPHDAGAFDPARDPDGLRLLIKGGAVALGECGLDYHYDHSPRTLQRRAFAAQLALAQETGKPVVVHTRDAEDDTAAMVREAGAAGIRGVLHCFTGSHALAHTGLAAGWYISFSGIVTFKTWLDDELLRLVPDSRLLVESDAPYLAPAPNRGKRNEPAWVERTVQRLAAARGTTAALLGDQLIRNAVALFDLPEVL